MIVGVASVTLILNRVGISSTIGNIDMSVTGIVVLEEEFILAGYTSVTAGLIPFTISNRSGNTSTIGVFVVPIITFRANKTVLSSS